MSEQPQTAPVAPADLPPETLIPYNSLAHLMPGSWERLIEAVAKIVTDFDQNQRRAQVML